MSRRPPIAVGLALGTALIALWAVAAQPPEQAEKEPRLVPFPVAVPAPPENPITPAKVELGRRLFFDRRLSGDNQMSCATCHLPEKGFADGLAKAKGHAGRILARHTPTVLNVAFVAPLFWDGRATSLEEQALGPITSPDEMNQRLEALVEELSADARYVRQFRQAFGEGISARTIARALAAYERILVTGPSPVDRFLRGEEDALSPSARRGFELFTGEAGCLRCHHGPALSDGKFHRLGVGNTKDIGRAAVTGRREDRFRFRTPSLRNVAQTAPYMHDGSLRTLEDVVTFYYRTVPTRGPENLPLDVEPLLDRSFSEIPDLVAFLKALSGPVPASAVPHEAPPHRDR